LNVTAAADINPDLNDRPSPVAVAIFQLKSVTRFNKADYFALYDPAANVLADDLVSREQVSMQPGEERVLVVELSPDTRYLGVTAAYRDIEQADWRTFVPVPADSAQSGGKPRSVDSIAVRLNARTVALSLDVH
jgi:type VI secretion system protein VasD